jgi:DNA-binding CsgD family transcriptional regulator
VPGLGADSARWTPHLLWGLSRLLGVPQASGGEGRWVRASAAIEALSAYDATSDPVAHAAFSAYHREGGGPTNDPIFQQLRKLRGRRVTRTRRDLVPDRAWYRSASFDLYRRAGGVDHAMVSLLPLPEDGVFSVLTLNRRLGDRDFSVRERRWLSFVHAEVGRLIGTALARGSGRGRPALSPRLRQTLACLLEGASEKQVASQLGLSRATVHQYVTALYRHYRVQSRAQLLVHVLAVREATRRSACR